MAAVNDDEKETIWIYLSVKYDNCENAVFIRNKNDEYYSGVSVVKMDGESDDDAVRRKYRKMFQRTFGRLNQCDLVKWDYVEGPEGHKGKLIELGVHSFMTSEMRFLLSHLGEYTMCWVPWKAILITLAEEIKNIREGVFDPEDFTLSDAHNTSIDVKTKCLFDIGLSMLNSRLSTNSEDSSESDDDNPDAPPELNPASA